MKKILGIFLALVVAYLLVTRFVEVPVPRSDKASPETPATCEESRRGSPFTCAVLQEIQKDYEAGIAPIFAAKCLMCHGQVDRMPLYAKLPPSSWLVRHDIEEAHEHFSMEPGFLLEEGRDVPDLLDDLKEVLEDGSMPPLVYLAMHWQSKLTPAEKDQIMKWIRSSEQKLEQDVRQHPQK